MLYSGSGISAISSVPFAFSEVLPALSLGTWTYLFQGLLILSLMLLRKRFVFQYLFSYAVGFVFGELLDFHELWVGMFAAVSLQTFIIGSRPTISALFFHIIPQPNIICNCFARKIGKMKIARRGAGFCVSAIKSVDAERQSVYNRQVNNRKCGAKTDVRIAARKESD